jgi:hypothetical protein
MMRVKKISKKTKPKTKASAKVPVKPIKKVKVKVKPKFNLKGIPIKYKMICNLAITHANTQTECDELLLVGVNAYEALLDIETLENAEKMKMQVVTQAILLKKETYPPIENINNLIVE